MRKGSKYFINEKEVRAKDVQTFFADLSTGAHSPSIISQGKIGTIGPIYNENQTIVVGTPEEYVEAAAVFDLFNKTS